MNNKETQDQIAAIMLLRGTKEQQLEALEYCNLVGNVISQIIPSLELKKLLKELVNVNKNIDRDNITDGLEELQCQIDKIEKLMVKYYDF
jgi:hypothetical protein